MASTLKSFRKTSGFTQQTVADAIGVTQGTVYQWEHGLCAPRTVIIPKLAELYKVPIDDIFKAVVCTATKEG